MTDPAHRRPWKKGFEIELMAPRGHSRRDLAERIAHRVGGCVKTVFYPQSEPSLVPGMPVFENLVLGFDILGADGKRVALCVDDLTLRDGLDPQTAPLPGWMRILSDDARLLALVTEHCDPGADIADVLAPVAALFGTDIEHTDGGIAKVVDRADRSIAMVAPLPGERERPCEIITPPYEDDPEDALTALLADAAALGFTLPREAAIHIHFDAAPLCDAVILSRLVDALHGHGAFLRDLVGTNPACVRLGPIADKIVERVHSEAFLGAGWEQARHLLADTKPTKYADFNFLNIAHALPGKHTFEARIFPGSMDAEEILRNARLMEAILVRAVEAAEPAAKDGATWLAALPLSRDDWDYWALRPGR
ncbi:amidoligase family protein [Maricaulis sp.]|uniref:amidoligase family protein n=1 Tax=Maricaulis sp. TaxID=1486257 RepID=UPI0025FC9DF4|nr:amidoligase family protein [Maricaulis sp.]MDF1769314.1 amidoligase family protein [Maricaulis sp.]